MRASLSTTPPPTSNSGARQRERAAPRGAGSAGVGESGRVKGRDVDESCLAQIPAATTIVKPDDGSLWATVSVLSVFGCPGWKGLHAPQNGCMEANLLQELTPRQMARVRGHWLTLQQQQGWSDELPVLLLERCWLRLSVVALGRLPALLPPDNSREAPELSFYRQLRREGVGSWEAQLNCWEEFGAEAFQQAQRRHWRALELGNHGWTLQSYLDLRADYRRRWQLDQPRSLPLLVLARSTETDRSELHRLVWVCPAADGNEPLMRHTCS